MLMSLLFAIMLLIASSNGPAPMTFEAVYRLPYADGTRVSVFDDAESHRPPMQLFACGLVGTDQWTFLRIAQLKPRRPPIAACSQAEGGHR